MSRTNSVTAGTVFLLMLAINSASAEELQIQGKSLFTFSGKYYVLQAERAFYQIEKKGLSPTTASKLEKSTLNNAVVSVSVPRGKIEYIWPNADYAPVETNFIDVEEPIADAGKVLLRGYLQAAFSEEYFEFLDKDTLYQITRSALSENEIKKFVNTGLSTRLVVAVPEAAIKGSWSFKQSPSRTLASVEESDSSEIRNSMMTLKGTILYSAESRFVIVQSGPTIYQLRKLGIGTKRPELLEINGSRVDLTVNVGNIAASW